MKRNRLLSAVVIVIVALSAFYSGCATNFR
jgi:hypothetical protein